MRAAPIIAALVCGACGTVSKPGAKPVLVGWRPVASYSGRGDAQTESFNIESGQWRIRWKTTNENPPGAGIFRITVHSAVSGRPLVVAVERRGVGHDTAYVNEDPRLYHLVIESRGLDWSLSIEESVVGYSRLPDQPRRIGTLLVSPCGIYGSHDLRTPLPVDPPDCFSRRDFLGRLYGSD